MLSLIISTFLLCFMISHVFLSVYLYQDLKEIKNFKSDIFAYMFGFSNVLLISILIEIADLDDFK